MTGAHTQMRENSPDVFVVEGRQIGRRRSLLDANKISKTGGEFVQWQDDVDDAVAIALRGIEEYSASEGSCTRMMPPDSLMARTPSDPSLPAPLRMMAKPSSSRSATDRKN